MSRTVASGQMAAAESRRPVALDAACLPCHISDQAFRRSQETGEELCPSARFNPRVLLIGTAVQALCQVQIVPTAQNTRLMAYDTFFRRVTWAEDRSPGLVAAVARDYELTDSEQARVIEIANDWRVRWDAVENQVGPLLAAGQSGAYSPALQDLLRNRLQMTSDHIDRLQAAFGPERFAAFEALITKPPPPAPPRPDPAQRARLTAYNAFFLRFWWLEDRAAYLDHYQGPIGSWTRTAAAREFGMTDSEHALVSPIVADWQAKNSANADQARKVSNGGRVTKSPEFQVLEEDRLKMVSDHVDQLLAALGPARFRTLDALVRKNNFLRGGPQNQIVLTVLDVDGQSTRVSSAGMEYEPLRRPGMSHMVALIVYTREGIEQFGWETISKVEIGDGRSTITLKTGETVSGAELPPHASLDGQADSSRRIVIGFSKIKTLTVSP